MSTTRPIVLLGAVFFAALAVHCSDTTASNPSASGAGTAGAPGTSGAPAAGTSGLLGSAGANTAGGAGGAAAGSSGAGASGAAVSGSGGALASAGAGGTSGAAGAGGGTTAGLCTPSGSGLDCNNVLNGLDGYLNRDDVNGSTNNADSPQVGCTPSSTPGQEILFKQQHWQLKGPGIETGKPYKVKLHVYGVVECKTYVGGTGPAKTDLITTADVTQSHNLWLAGGKDNGDRWNTLTLTVTDAPTAAVNGIGPQTAPLPAVDHTYDLNQCPGSSAEAHYTWRLDYDAEIPVTGGSYINYVEYDSNCVMVANCGAAEASQSCAGPYNIVDAVKNAVPATNAGFAQPLANTATPAGRGQWWLIDVTAVDAI